MTKISDLLDVKGRDVVTIEPDATVYEAIERMSDQGVGSLIVRQGESIDAGTLSLRLDPMS